MPMRNVDSLPVNKVFCVTTPETGKYFRVFSVEQIIEMEEDGRLDGKIVTLMRSNEGLGGPRGKVRETKKIVSISY